MKIIFDAVNILFQQNLDPVTPMVVNISKANHAWIADSYFNHGIKNILGPLLGNLLYFSTHEKNQINEETIEFLEPYLALSSSDDPPKKLFDAEVAAQTSKALWGLCTWAGAMSDYHKQSKIV